MNTPETGLGGVGSVAGLVPGAGQPRASRMEGSTPVLVRQRGRLLVAALVAGAAACVGLVLLARGTEEAGVGAAVRVTGALSLTLFLLAYSADPLDRLLRTSGSRVLVAYRRYLGVSFGIVHLVHAGGLFWLASLSTRSFAALGPVLITLLSIGYVFVIAMLATSNDRAQRWLGANWRRLHLAGLHYVWLLFFVAYARALRSSALYLIPVAFVLGALGLRIAARRHVR